MKNYTYSFTTKKSPKEVFELLQNVEEWWSGIYEETITGKSQKPGDEFSFSAGGGMHFSKQKLAELIPNQKIVWQVTESNLSFLKKPKEWENTNIVFDISEKGKDTQVTFTHKGLEPGIECYDSCSNAWAQYLYNLKNKLN
ncbi:MAG: SRPBCC domain-containing protein [Agriterribacter sp.]